MTASAGPPSVAGAALDYDALFRIIRRRYTVRRYRPDPVPDTVIEQVLEAARWAPSGANHQPWEFIVVKDPARIAQIGDVFRREEISLRAGDAKFNWPKYSYVSTAPCLVVVCADPRLKRVINRPRPPENKEKTFLFSVANAVEHLHLAATALGLGSVWLTVQEIDLYEQELRQLLQVPDPVRIAVVCPLGYPVSWPGLSETGVHARRPLAELVHHETYDRGRFRDDAQLEDFVRTATFRRTKGSWEAEEELP